LVIEGLHREGVLQNINFHLRKGEVVGLWGLMGSGRTELARALVGLDPISAGVMKIKDNGSLRTIRPKEAKDMIGMITEDRREEGLLLPMSVKIICR
jgi:ABC-type sugar transport system ATPase subunit